MRPLTVAVCDRCGRTVPWHWHTITPAGGRVCGDCAGVPRPRPRRAHQRLDKEAS